MPTFDEVIVGLLLKYWWLWFLAGLFVCVVLGMLRPS